MLMIKKNRVNEVCFFLNLTSVKSVKKCNIQTFDVDRELHARD